LLRPSRWVLRFAQAGGLGSTSLGGMQGKFQPGDHLHVRRRLGYYHHGIYISDDRVIQFGGGVTLQNKAGTAMAAVSLAEFENGGTAEVVRYGYESWFTGHHPPTDEGWKAVARAEFLLKLQPRLPYNVVGHNCEIIANMCASGSWT
jgi:Lecithin retinol acyltransferase